MSEPTSTQITPVGSDQSLDVQMASAPKIHLPKVLLFEDQAQSDEDPPLTGWRAKIPCLFAGRPSRYDYIAILIPALLFSYSFFSGFANMIATSGEINTVNLRYYLTDCCNGTLTGRNDSQASKVCCPSSVPACCECFGNPWDWSRPPSGNGATQEEADQWAKVCDAWGEYYYGHPANYSEYNNGGWLAETTFCDPNHILDPGHCYQKYLNARVMFALNVAAFITGIIQWLSQEITYYYNYRKGVRDKVPTQLGFFYTKFFCDRSKIHFYATLNPRPLLIFFFIFLSIEYLSALAHFMTGLIVLSQSLSRNAVAAGTITMVLHFKRIIDYLTNCQDNECGGRCKQSSDKAFIGLLLWLFCEGGFFIILLIVFISTWLGYTSGGY